MLQIANIISQEYRIKDRQRQIMFLNYKSHNKLLFASIYYYFLFSLLVAVYSQTLQQQTDYLNGLQSIYQNMKAQIEQMDNINFKTNDSMETVKGQTYLQKILLQQWLKQQRNLILFTESQSQLPKKQWECTNLTTQQINLLNKKIQQLEIIADNMTNIINSLEQCQRNDELVSNAQFLNIYISNLKQEANNVCSLNPSVTNINSNSTNNTTSVLTPTTLINNTTINSTNSTNSTIISTNYSNTTNSNSTNWTNQTIISSSTNNTNQNWTSNATTPIIIPTNTSNFTNSNNTYPSNYSTSSNTTNQTNSFTSNNISSNNSNSSQQAYNTNSTITSCPSGQIFDIRTNTCITPTYLSNIPQSIINFYGSSSSQINSIPQGTVALMCPLQYPFSNSTHCLNCIYPSFFNYTNKMCQSCPVNQIFQLSMRICVNKNVLNPSLSNLSLIKNSYIAFDGNFYGKIPVFASEKQSCDASSPYFNGSECIRCEIPNYFNFYNLKCETCQPGLNFNVISRNCEVPLSKFKYYSNLNSEYTFYNGNESELNTQIFKIKTGASATQCPSNLPNFDKTLNLCMKCDLSEPIFNYKLNKCMQCPLRSVWVTSSRKCIANVGGPTIQRAVMNSNW